MSKKLEDLINFINTLLNARLSDKHFINVANNETWLELSNIKLALLELQSIKEANPSEALEGLEQLAEMADKCWVSCDVHKWKTTIKQALLKAQEPKQYLKWEDLEFYSEWKCKAVKLNGTKYKIKYKCDFDFFNNYYQEVVIYSDDDRTVFAKLRDKKQFFNDLHLERVEE